MSMVLVWYIVLKTAGQMPDIPPTPVFFTYESCKEAEDKINTAYHLHHPEDHDPLALCIPYVKQQ